MDYQASDLDRTYAQAVALYDSNRLNEARELFEGIVAKEPENTAALIGLGMTCWRGEAFHDARCFLNQVLLLKPADEGAIRGLCLTLLSLGEFAEAEDLIEQAVSPERWSHQAKLAAGLVKQSLRKWREAAWWYESALATEPRYAEALNNLGVVLQELGEYALARDKFGAAILANPSGTDAYRNLALLASREGQSNDATILLLRALQNNPASALLWNDLGKINQARGDTARAVAAFEESARLDPKSVEPVSNLSLLMYHEGYSERARALCDRLIGMRPPNMGARFRKALALPAIMMSSDAIAETRERLLRELDELEDARGVIHDPLREVNVSNFYLAYHGHNERELQSRVAALFRAKTPMLNYIAPHIGRARSGKIRIGVCSRHWGAHTIGVLFAELFARLDPREFEVTCFHTATGPAGLSDEFRDYGHQMIQLPLDLQGARAAIVNTELDVLVYPDIGMEPFSYFLAFSRLAAKQVVMWGHPLTTGIPTIDNFLSARSLETEDADSHYTEKLVRFEHLNTYYRRPEADARYNREYFGFQPDRTLYVCPQTLFKLHPDFDRVLADILTRDPSGELILLEGNHVGHTTMLRERFDKTLAEFRGRIKFLRRLSNPEYMGLLAATDVMLDPPHFGGGSTSLQALSVGTPIVTAPSMFARGRITAACYRVIGNEELVANDASHYVEIAHAVGSDPSLRARLRGDLSTRSEVLYQNEAAVVELSEFLRSQAIGS